MQLSSRNLKHSGVQDCAAGGYGAVRVPFAYRHTHPQSGQGLPCSLLQASASHPKYRALSVHRQIGLEVCAVESEKRKGKLSGRALSSADRRLLGVDTRRRHCVIAVEALALFVTSRKIGSSHADRTTSSNDGPRLLG
eukprot:2677663-Rhodomonas_salina.2